ncbi:neuroligin-4, Y-linked-like [Daktulosphaira vitifoliae]|uniref:neuroligin-4, Y-linked-like n=1 Tax=Daktulosphaira vitifoliae TaxID=58002 RepID=UPI0021AA474C|nr:neuroligin-4, Y-linked-like [Daktulosphaira vitifoliae]XP_050534525.1 neuroligin-4, Y-linked-like [Daktulosphaira vitifoliae]XP_050534526.1 neuroligin-4, Y-linked-like [Daktulosphaira vitifoliae]XP_050534528.1 neuroligin-4, Y-linked-like [Daktulosphaira vitifoliae]
MVLPWWLPVAFVFGGVSAALTSSRVVRTKYGDVSGVIVTPDNRRLDAVEVFRGVPYASPPIGSLRFMPPVTGSLWSGVKVADRFGPVCPQRLPNVSDETIALKTMARGRIQYLRRLLPYLQNQSEDCLYLNIYSPARVNYDGSEKITLKPVVVFIHGESYEWNSGNPYDGTVLASYGGLVVITINYRLGVLGFLNLNSNQHLKSPSNYGLMDQIAALHWIQENIAVFGGDPTNVTLMGHGTGASCVGFLMTSSAVPDVLFHRAILLSGSPLSPLSLVRDPVNYGHQVAKLVNCSPDLPHLHLLNCLRDRPLEQILNAQIDVPEFTTSFGPSVDGVIIDVGAPESSRHGAQSNSPNIFNGLERSLEDPNELVLANGFGPAILTNPAARQRLLSRLTRFDLMLGVVRAESFFAFTGDDVQYGIEADRRTKILKTYVKNTYKYHLTEILATIVNEYTDWDRPIQHPVNIRDETLEALSDAQVVAPVINTADLHSANRRNSYLFVFDYQTKYGDYQQRQGCVHGEELPYIFGAPLVGGLMHFPRNYTKSEILLSEAAVIYWSNFARTGNPNEPQDQDMLHKQEHGRFKNIEWTAYETVHKKYLSLDTKPKLKSHYRAHRLSFWLNLVPELHKPGEDVPYSHHMFQSDLQMMTFKPGTERTTRFPESYFRGGQPPIVVQHMGGNKTLVNAGSVSIPENTTTTTVLQPPPVVVASSSSSDRGEVDDERQLKDAASGDKEDNRSTSPEGQDDGGASGAGTPGYASFPLALAVAIGIGCSLLFLNIMIFAVIYYNKSTGGNGGRRGSRNTADDDEDGRQNDKIKNMKRPENGGPMTNLCSTGGATELLQMMESRTAASQKQPHSILKKPLASSPQPAPPPDLGGDLHVMPVHHSVSVNGGSTLTRPSQLPPVEFADVTQNYHGGTGGGAATLPRPPPPPKCPRPDHHHHNHHHHQHSGTLRRHGQTAIPACTCINVAQPIVPTTSEAVKTVEELHV